MWNTDKTLERKRQGQTCLARRPRLLRSLRLATLFRAAGSSGLVGALLLGASGCSTLRWPGARTNESSSSLSMLRSVDSHTQAEACLRTGLELAGSERDDHAVTQLERARQFDATIKGVAHPLAVLYDRQGKMDAADREYRIALKEMPRNADVASDYGYFLYSRGEIPAAEKQLRRALSLKKDHPKARLNLALVLAAQENYDESFAAFEAAVGPAAAHHNIGMLMARAGREDEARRHLAMAVEGDPSLLKTREVLTALDATPSARREIQLTGHEVPASP